MDKMWKNYNKWNGKCYSNMIGVEKDFSVWEKTFQILMNNIREEQKNNKAKSKSIYDIEERLDFECDISGWLEDYLDEMDMYEEYEILAESCRILLSLFQWDEGEASDLKMRLSFALLSLEKYDEAEKICVKWYEKDCESIEAATALMYVKIAKSDYEAAEELFLKNAHGSCNEETEILYVAAEKLYEKSGDKKKLKEIKSINKQYEKEINEKIERMLEEDEDDEDELYDFLPFN